MAKKKEEAMKEFNSVFKKKGKVMEKYSDMIEMVKEVTTSDVHKLHEAEKSYGNSWKHLGS